MGKPHLMTGKHAFFGAHSAVTQLSVQLLLNKVIASSLMHPSMLIVYVLCVGHPSSTKKTTHISWRHSLVFSTVDSKQDDPGFFFLDGEGLSVWSLQVLQFPRQSKRTMLISSRCPQSNALMKIWIWSPGAAPCS